MRSNIIATHFKSKHSDANIHFVLSEQAPYINDCQFPVHLTPSSPTNCTNEVKKIIDGVEPDVVIFDASGRGKQMEYARKNGARVVFISQHPKKRKKGLSLSRLPFINQHWIAQPEFAMTPMSVWDKVKLKLYRKRRPIYLGCLYQQPSLVEEKHTLTSYGLIKNEYALFSAGSGGHTLEGKPASLIFSAIATKLSDESNLKSVVVLGSSFIGEVPENTASVTFIRALANNSFIGLLSNCQFAVLSGGGSLLQAISMERLVVATAVAKDQPARIRACADEGLILRAEPNAQDVYAALQHILKPETRLSLSKAMAKSTLSNGVEQTEKLLTSLLNEAQ